MKRGGPEKCVKPFSKEIDVPGPYKGKGNKNEWGERLSDILTNLMRKDIATIQREYDRAVQTEHPGSITVHSWSETESLWMSLISSFPNATFNVEHQIGREDPLHPPRAAVCWSMSGKVTRMGLFGQPTNVDVYITSFATEWSSRLRRIHSL